jgi:hypothetical protein
MSLKEELLTAAKPFLMKEGLESSKEIIATNSTSFDEMGMANSKPGEFSQEEITDPENLVNVSRMANDNNFNADDSEGETVVSILGISDDKPEDTLGDLVNLGTGASCECDDPEHCDCLKLSNIIESILRKKDKAFLESLNEGEELEEAPVDDWPGFVPAQPGIGKWATALMSRIRANGDAIKDGRIQVPDNIKQNWQKYVDAYKQYSISNLGSPKYNTILRAVAAKSSNPNMINNPTEEDCAAFASALNSALKKEGENALQFNFEPGSPLNNTIDKSSTNYQNRSMFLKAYADANASGDIKRGSYGVLNTFDTPVEEPVEAPVATETPASTFSDEDAALLQKNGIALDNPQAEQILGLIKNMQGMNAPAATKPAAKKSSKLKKALESVLAESDYAGNLSYNPDKRLNASDILNAVKNAVKPELAAKLSVVKNVDANEEPSYAIQNIDEKDLPATLEIDTNTDKKVVLKKDGNSYKFDK